jgi:alpha-galactosidase
VPAVSNHGQLIHWGHSALTLELRISPDAPPTITRLDPTDAADASPQDVPSRQQPLAEVLVAGEGRGWSGTRSIASAVGARLRYTGQSTESAGHGAQRSAGARPESPESSDGPWMQLRVDAIDPVTGLRVEVFFRTVDGLAAIQTWTRVINEASTPTVLHAVSSFVTSAFLTDAPLIDAVDLHWARSEWLAEGRWQSQPVRDVGLPDLDMAAHGYRSRGCFAVTSTGSWSTSEALPIGVLVHRPTGRSWAWQIEHNGAWRWEIGETRDGLYLATMGPTDSDHQWRHVLDPSGSFSSVPVGVAVSDHGMEGAVAALTAYRRRIVRDHPDRDALPVVFNDYMNTLMGDPTSDALLPLIDAAAQVGAEYFCIDAGWHDETRAGHWAQEMGAWEPSTTRFPEGLAAIIDKIRAAGMVPGLWLEPEVMGLGSQVAQQLPDEAFFMRNGRRHVEDGRYHLDLRHPAAVSHLDGVIDRLVSELGVGYFKFDYNIDAGPGTEVMAASPGDGLLGHNRAHLAWLDGLLDRHPGLVIENCGSGAMRMDYGILSRVQLQSTSDQQNPLRYPPIAAAAPMAILPEQSASWAYPQPDMSDEEIASCMVTGMMGRLYQSGHLDQMSPEQLRLVADGIAAHKSIRAEISRAAPVWPLGLPGWADPWVALGLHPQHDADGATYLAVWQRAGATQDVSCELPHLTGRTVRPEVIYPRGLAPWHVRWEAGSKTRPGVLTIATDHPAPAARLIKLAPES